MRIVIATDGSDLAIAAGQRALTIVQPGAEIVLVNATGLDTSPDTGAGGIEGPDASPEELEQAREQAHIEAEATLTTTAAALGLVGCEQHVVDGDPRHSLTAAAESLDADVVVVGSHGRGPIGKAFLGSVSDYLVRHAPCPVLVIRAT